MNRSRRSSRVPYAALLIAGLAVLALAALRLFSRSLPPTATPGAQASASPSALRMTERSGPGSTLPADGSSEALADEWARAILDGVEPLLLAGPETPSGLAWWQSSERQGMLSPEGDSISQGPLRLLAADYTLLEIQTPDPQHPEQLLRLGTIRTEAELLRLSTAPLDTVSQGRQWLIGGGGAEIALRALALQAAERDYELIVATTDGVEATTLQLLLVELRSTLPTATVTPGSSPTATATATPTLTPTPSRIPEIAMSLVVNEGLDPVIERMVNDIDPGLTRRILEDHPFAGRLTWGEAGPLINGRSLSVGMAQRFSIFTINEQGLLGAEKVFDFEIAFETTRFIDQQVFFQGHRLEEALYWMVRRAAEADALLVVAYDDYGTRQALTVIGLEALPPDGTEIATPAP